MGNTELPAIRQICGNRPNGNSVVHIKIVNIYLFPKSTELQFGELQIYTQTETEPVQNEAIQNVPNCKLNIGLFVVSLNLAKFLTA